MKALSTLALCALLGGGCNNVALYSADSQPNLPNKASFQGDVCTEDPSEVAFTVYTLIAVDITADETDADPEGSRATAIQALMARYNTTNYVYGFVTFGHLAVSLTKGFTSDMSVIPPAIETIAAGGADGQRSYLEPLRVITTAVQDDILAATPGDRSRRRYEVIFVVDGPPVPTLPNVWCPENMLAPGDPTCTDALAATFCPNITPVPQNCEGLLYPQMVADLRSYALSNGAIDMQFHVVSLKDDPVADGYLSQMAIAGRGAYLVQGPSGINLNAIDISTPSSILQRREQIVFNPNAVIRQGSVIPDSDGDGLADSDEALIGTQPDNPDSDGDHVGDQVEFLLETPGSEFNPLVSGTFVECAQLTDLTADSDSDGLADCEEILLRTEPSLVDTDKDGFPDLVEVRRHSDPLSDDTLDDPDDSGITIGDKLRDGLDASSSGASGDLDLGYRYRFFDEGPTTRLEMNPAEPIPGVVVTSVQGGFEGPGQMLFSPPNLQYSTDAVDPAYGDPVDISAGGTFTLSAPDGQTVQVDVTTTGLPTVQTSYTALVKEAHRFCFSFDIRNVTLVQSLETPAKAGIGWNDIRLYMAQRADDSTNGLDVVSQASVPMRYIAPNTKIPNQAFINLVQSAFVLIGGGGP